MAVVILRPCLKMVLLGAGRGQVGINCISGKVDVKMETISGIFFIREGCNGLRSQRKAVKYIEFGGSNF